MPQEIQSDWPLSIRFPKKTHGGFFVLPESDKGFVLDRSDDIVNYLRSKGQK
jgi:hypothetical protein